MRAALSDWRPGYADVAALSGLMSNANAFVGL
jgi:hypothetical protein